MTTERLLQIKARAILPTQFVTAEDVHDLIAVVEELQTELSTEQARYKKLSNVVCQWMQAGAKAGYTFGQSQVEFIVTFDPALASKLAASGAASVAAFKDKHKRIAELEAALVNQRRKLAAQHDKTIAELTRVREVAAKEIGRLETALATERARLKPVLDAAQYVLEHSRDADCGDHCRNSCMWCALRAAIDSAREG